MRDVLKEARLFRFLLWYDEARRFAHKENGIIDFIESVISQVNKGKILSDKQLEALERIQHKTQYNKDLMKDLEGHALDIY